MSKKYIRIFPSFIIVCLDLFLMFSIPSQVKIYQEGIVNTRFMPYLLTILILICGLTDIVKGLFLIRREPEQAAEEETAGIKKSGYLRVAAAAAGVALWLILLPKLGFMLASVLLTAGIMLLAGNKSWIQIVLVSLILTIAVYCVFKLALNLKLPQGLFFF